MLNEISGGVCAARGFQAAGVHCGVKASSSPDKNDLALILSERECAAAAVYTLNRVKSAPVYVTKMCIRDRCPGHVAYCDEVPSPGLQQGYAGGQGGRL